MTAQAFTIGHLDVNGAGSGEVAGKNYPMLTVASDGATWDEFDLLFAFNPLAILLVVQTSCQLNKAMLHLALVTSKSYFPDRRIRNS